jgi:hypothetical protein
MKNLSLSFIDPNVMLLLAILLPSCLIFWFFDVKKMRRPVAVGFSLAAALLVIGVSTWQDSLASLISTPRSLAVLVIVATASICMFAVHLGSGKKMKLSLRRGDAPAAGKQGKDRYHHVWTHVAGAIAGTTAALLFADGINFLRAVGKAPSGAGSALTTTMHRVASGKAAAAVQAGHGLPPTAMLGAVVAGLAVLVYFARRHPTVRTEPKAKAAVRGAPTRAAIPSGPPPQAAIDRRAH